MTAAAHKLPELLTEREVAELVGTSPGTLRQDRSADRGLPYVRIGRRIRYRADDIEAYLDAHTVRPGA
ncbi:helix-turn-helix transcriptional regulator [Nocardia testacea]|uniref:helix-turn-helix transcriptional regulator n=1 Tax=Nocardia testacea TaxID=248551 RepID=UPI0002FFD0E4|nr:helix-turn-helix domain-containing protein [Nocardia testacea]